MSDESEGTDFVINRYPNRAKTNLGTQFKRIADRAGLNEIPRPFDNMRASRSTEVNDEFGSYCESQWIGHTIKIARKHYLQIRASDVARAANWSTPMNEPVLPGVVPDRGTASVSRLEPLDVRANE